jgi:transposase
MMPSEQGKPMRHVAGESREQLALLPESLEDFVAANDPARVIEALVMTLDVRALGFDKTVTKGTGRKPYHPADLLKLYVYGYLNRVSTSRRLERECQRNVEVMWLLRRLQPDSKTIADFRKDNGAAIRGACAAFIQFCRKAQLLSAQQVAIDSSKFKAAASIDQSLTRNMVKRDQAEIEKKIQEYLERLDRADEEDSEVELDRKRVEEALEKLKQRKQRLGEFERGMAGSGRNEYCVTEPDALLMRSGREGTLLGYSVQTATEAETGLIVHHEVTQAQGDTDQLLPVAEPTQATLGVARLEVLADGGYSNGEYLDACERREITAIVPRRIIPGSGAEFQKSHFTHEPEHDRYRCPAGELLRRTGQSKRHNFYLYARSGCGQCPLRPRCTTAKNSRGPGADARSARRRRGRGPGGVPEAVPPEPPRRGAVSPGPVARCSDEARHQTNATPHPHHRRAATEFTACVLVTVGAPSISPIASSAAPSTNKVFRTDANASACCSRKRSRADRCSTARAMHPPCRRESLQTPHAAHPPTMHSSILRSFKDFSTAIFTCS